MIRPIIDKEFGKRNEIYEVSYSHPYLLDHYREEGMESLLEKRIENNVSLSIVFYDYNPDKKEYLKDYSFEFGGQINREREYQQKFFV